MKAGEIPAVMKKGIPRDSFFICAMTVEILPASELPMAVLLLTSGSNHCRFISSFFNFFTAFFSFIVLAGSFLTAFLLSCALLMNVSEKWCDE